MAEHEHGSMSTTQQEKTFAGFMRWSIWVTVAVLVILVFLALVGA